MTSPQTSATAGATKGTSVSGGLWIRVSANLPRRKVAFRLAGSLLGFPVPEGAPPSLMRHAAAGYLMELWGSLAEHTSDGVITDIPDEQLELWAGWDGKPGVFAAWVRERHYNAETGTVREWEEFAGALQAKRTSDAQRQREKREREKRAREATRSFDPLNVMPAQNFPTSAVDRTALAQQLTIAANKGLYDNPAVGGMFNPINSGRGDAIEAVEFFLASGVPVDDFPLLARIVFTIAKGYKPAKRGDQIYSLTYVREPALATWQRHRDDAAARSAPSLEEVTVGAGAGGNGRRGADVRGRAHRTAVGAMAAAESAGFSDE